MLRDREGVIGVYEKQMMAEEIGDVLWYAAMLAVELNTTLSSIARDNVEKLQSRQTRGVLGGSGDNR